MLWPSMTSGSRSAAWTSSASMAFRVLASIEDAVPTAIIRQGDENNPILGTLRVWEGPGGIDFDIELQAMHLIKGHRFEERTTRLQQILLGRVGDEVELLGCIILRPVTFAIWLTASQCVCQVVNTTR